MSTYTYTHVFICVYKCLHIRNLGYELLMLVAESLVALLYPFEWQRPYAPIVPSTGGYVIVVGLVTS